MFRLGINEEMATTLAALTLRKWLSWQKPINWFVTFVLTAPDDYSVDARFPR